MLSLDSLSKIGLGTYRMSALNKEHCKSLKLAVKLGCNVIDTSSNYQYGESENLVGQYIKEHPRKDLFIITKAGYVTRNEMNAITSLKRERKIKPADIVTVNTTTHCIHPDFLFNQIRRSLKRLNRKSLDGFLIHNPEYYLQSKSLTADKKTYYQRIQHAFEMLEELSLKGIVSYYGVSSNTLSVHDSTTNTSINELLRIAQKVSPHHRFRLIQFPFNLFEQGPLNEDAGKGNAIAIARENGLITFSNRPLNCHTPNGFIRLALYEPMSDAEVRAAEESHTNFMDLISKKMRSIGVDNDPMEYEIIAHLDKHWKSIGNHSAVDSLFAGYLAPFLNNFYDNSIAEKDFTSSQMSTKEKKIIISFYQSCKKFSTQVMSTRCLQAINELEQRGQFSSVTKNSIPQAACEYYLKNGINHVLAGMTKEKYVAELHHLF